MELKTDRLIIHEATYEEANQISEQNGGDSVDNFLASLSNDDIAVIFQDKAAVSDLLTRLSNSLGNGNSDIYGAWKDESLVGFIAIVDGESGKPELQIEIAPQYHGKGFGFEFLDALLRYLFKEKSYQYIQYTVLPNNKPSISLVSRIGAKLQPPKSEAERLLIRTYHISKDSMSVH